MNQELHRRHGQPPYGRCQHVECRPSVPAVLAVWLDGSWRNRVHMGMVPSGERRAVELCALHAREFGWADDVPVE